MAQLRQLFAGDAVAQFRLIAQSEQRFLAAGIGADAGHGENFIGGHIGPLALARRMGEGAIVANIPAQLGQGDENFPGITDQTVMAPVP